jgi:hypothetical protein
MRRVILVAINGATQYGSDAAGFYRPHVRRRRLTNSKIMCDYRKILFGGSKTSCRLAVLSFATEL